jgi:hypothetical protein
LNARFVASIIHQRDNAVHTEIGGLCLLIVAVAEANRALGAAAREVEAYENFRSCRAQRGRREGAAISGVTGRLNEQDE